jgi:flagellar hook-associated protein 1
MPGLSQILETARRALMSQQVALGVTSHNVANASTPGYSRQRASLVPTMPSKQSFGLLGTGVMTQSVGRIRDQFIDQQIRYSNQSMGDASAQQQILSQVEASFNEPSSAGLSSAITSFFNAFQDLSTHPEDTSARNEVVQQGTLMGQQFQRLHTEISELRQSLSDDVSVKILKINTLTKEISDLDVQITNAIAVGGDPSDAKDQRDLKLEELSKLANISVGEDAKGSVIVSVGGMVIASRAGAVALKAQSVGNQIQVVTESSSVPVNVSSGELGGVLKLYNTTLPDYLTKLDQLAGAMITRVNAVHSGGYGLGTPPSTGVNFFTGTGAADMRINAAIEANSNLVAASGDGSPGDNTIALAIANVTNEQLLNSNSQSLSQFYNSLVSQVGSAINAVDSTSTSQELILAQLENQRASVSGVSLDEEMTDMIKFQRAYDAAAKLVTTADQMFQTILNMV